MIHIYTGKGKGKTTAAAGLTLRALSAGKKVTWIQFVRGMKPSGELRILGRLPRVSILQFGSKRWLHRNRIREKDKMEAEKAWEKAAQILRRRAADVLILNEINVTLDFGLLPLAAVIEELKKSPPGMEIILTGRNAPPRLTRLADYVTEMKEVRHPYRRGVRARRGIDY